MLAPGSERWDQALRKIPYSVHVSPFISEMSLYADLLLPSATYLEEWGYDHSPAGGGVAEVRLKQPVVKPLGETRAISDVLFHLSKNLEAVAPSFANLGDGPEGFVKFRTSPLMPWKEFLRKGVWTGPNYQYKKYQRIFNTPSKKFEFTSGNLRSLMAKKGKRDEELNLLPQYREANFLGKKDQYPFVLIPYQPLMVIENGSQNYPWAQEIFLPMHGRGWETLIEINREVGERMGFRNGQMIWVESPFEKIKGRVKLSDGIHPEVVAIPSGQGHYAYGKWQQGIGVNPHEIIGVDYDRLSGQAAFFNTRVKIYKV
jgi:molybdopterin-containing oxidoreductase family iron-sulfur binding subunit